MKRLEIKLYKLMILKYAHKKVGGNQVCLSIYKVRPVGPKEHVPHPCHAKWFLLGYKTDVTDVTDVTGL